jgi:hypothetical protein
VIGPGQADLGFAVDLQDVPEIVIRPFDRVLELDGYPPSFVA